MDGTDNKYLLGIMEKLQSSEVEQLKYLLQDNFTVDEDIIEILLERNLLEDTLRRQTIKKALQIIGRYDLAAGVKAIDICPVKGLTKEKIKLNGFGWMNYKRSEEVLKRSEKEEKRNIIAKKIFEYQFKRESLEIHDGADTKEILTYAKWEDRCKKLLDTFFMREGESSGIILFPDTETAVQSQTCQVQTWQRVMSTLNAWCKSSNPKDATGLIIRNYNLKDHFDFCGITNDDIKDVLSFKESKNMFNFQESNKRFLAFNPSLKVILIFRLVELLECDMQLLKKELDYCIDEVNLLCFLLKDVLEDTGIIVTGLAGYSGENAHMLNACKDCFFCVVPFKIFETVESFQSFWKLFAKENLESLRRDVEDSETVRKEKNNSFQAVASKVVGYLAHLQFRMLEKPILPVKKNNPTSNIKEAELLLDRYQMEIAYSDDKRLWLEGNYGTGKTIVALKKLELLLKNLREKEVIYFVIFSGKSQLDFAIKQKFKQKNVRVIKGGLSLSNIVKTQILPKEKELGTESINLIVDEYSSESLSTEEARSLGLILDTEDQFKNSTILIASQPMEINRFDNFYGFHGVKTTFYQKREELGELIEFMGMNVRTLKNVMRTTIQINILVEITQRYLKDQSNQYVRKEQKLNEGRFRKMVSKVIEKLRPRLKKNASSKPSSGASGDSSNPATNDRTFQSQKIVNSSNPATSSRPSQYQEIIDYDELHRLMPTEIILDKNNYQETVTKYRYTCPSQIGHNISGSLPKLIKLEESTDVYEQMALIASVLDEIIIPAETRRTAVIHFEPNDPLWLKSLFQLSKFSSSLVLTTEVETFLTDPSGNLVLVKNMNFVKGLEFSNVLLVLDSNEHHLRHYIPETIARCTNNLSILIRPSFHVSLTSGTVADLVDEWERERNSQGEPVVSILKIGFCFKDSCNNMRSNRIAYCVDKKDGFYGVHKNYELYEYFLEETQRTYVPDIQPDYVRKQEAKALLDAVYQDKKTKAEIDDPHVVKRFHDAARKGDVSVVVKMLRDGVPVDCFYEDARTALYWAVYYNGIDVVNVLLESGANVNRQDRNGRTPLIQAAINNNTDVMEVLLHHGADPSIVDVVDKTALEWARMRYREEAIWLLEKY